MIVKVVVKPEDFEPTIGILSSCYACGDDVDIHEWFMVDSALLSSAEPDAAIVGCDRADAS